MKPSTNDLVSGDGRRTRLEKTTYRNGLFAFDGKNFSKHAVVVFHSKQLGSSWLKNAVIEVDRKSRSAIRGTAKESHIERFYYVGDCSPKKPTGYRTNYVNK